MMNREHLHLLINEEIYVIDKPAAPSSEFANKPTENKEKTEPKTEPAAKTPSNAETPPLATPQSQAEPKITPVAIFHESHEESELILLQKIIDACKLKPNSYEVYANGFNKEVRFEKALVFVGASKAFYETIPYQGGQIVCSKPLGEIDNNKQEKMKLWGALQKFF